MWVGGCMRKRNCVPSLHLRFPPYMPRGDIPQEVAPHHPDHRRRLPIITITITTDSSSCSSVVQCRGWPCEVRVRGAQQRSADEGEGDEACGGGVGRCTV